MQIYVNDHPILLFRGASVHEAIQCYSQLKSQQTDSVPIYDRQHRVLMPDSKLTDGMRIYIDLPKKFDMHPLEQQWGTDKHVERKNDAILDNARQTTCNLLLSSPLNL